MSPRMLVDHHYPHWRLTFSICRGPLSLDRYLANRVRLLQRGPLATWRFGWAWVSDCRGAIPYPAPDPLYWRTIEAITEDLVRRIPEGKMAIVVDEISARLGNAWQRMLVKTAALNHVALGSFDQVAAAVRWARPALLDQVVATISA